MSAPRTLVVFHLPGASGPFRDLELGLDWLADAGELAVAVPGPGQVADAFRPVAPVAELAYSPVSAPEGPAALAGALRRLVREVRAFRAHLRAARPDVVVVATTTLPSAVIAARLERVPMVVYAAEIPAGAGGGRSFAAAGRALIALSRRLASAIVACSATVARQFERSGGPEVAVAYPPIRDAYSDGDRDGFRAAIGVPAEDPCIVAVGSITPGRGQDVLIRALPKIRREVPSARCVIVGTPYPRRKDLAYRAELTRIVGELDLGDAVVFVDAPPRIADAYAAADVMVNPARGPESFGRAACEALAAGRPVVATRVGGVPEALRAGETALLVEPDDPEALAAGVVSLLRDPDYAKRIAAAGRRDVLERFPPEQAREAFRRVIESVTASGRRP